MQISVMYWNYNWILQEQQFIGVLYRNNHPEIFFERRCSWKFRKFTGKHLCCSFFFQKSSRPLACNFIKEDTPTQVFLWILQFFKNSFFHRTSSVGCFCLWNSCLKTIRKSSRSPSFSQYYWHKTLLVFACEFSEILQKCFFK